jgi:predicted anti-sigma-YlaC factor YlaD
MDTETVQRKLTEDIKRSLDLVRSLRDEARVQMHLAGMETRELWDKLEPQVEAVERTAQEATESSRIALQEAVKLLREFLATLRKD